MLNRLQCRKYRAWITRYLTGDLDPESRVAQFERHVASCEPCKQAVTEKRRLLNELLARNASEEDLQEALQVLGMAPSVNRPLGIAMSLVLVAALFVSAYLWRLANPGNSLLGPKATTLGVGHVEPTTPAPSPERTAAPSTSAGIRQPAAVEDTAELATPKVAEAQRPTARRKPVPDRTPAQPAVRHPAPQREQPKPQPRSEVEILDASGSVIRRAGSNIPQ